MRLLFISLLLFSSHCFAGIEKVSVKNLYFNYIAPAGEGTLDKVGLGYSLKNVTVPYRVLVTRSAHSFEVTSDFLDFSWMNPYKFVYNLEKLNAKKLSFAIGEEIQWLEAEELKMVPQDRGEYLARKVKLSCQGSDTGKLKKRVLEDCRTHLDGSVSRVEVPNDFILYQILYDLPSLPGGSEMPADNLRFSSRNGNFKLELYISYYFYAGLRAQGQFHYEDNHETIAIKVNQIKFGYLNVTNFAMRRLQAVVKSPDIKIDPPWIRINIGKPNEDRASRYPWH